MNIVARFANDESGATAIEYGLIAALIAVGIIAAATTLGSSLSGLFNKISGKLNNAPLDLETVVRYRKGGREPPLFFGFLNHAWPTLRTGPDDRRPSGPAMLSIPRSSCFRC